MLQDIRHNIQGTTAKIVIGLIVVSFSIFGIESILVGGGGSSVAEVNGDEVTPQELQQAVNTQKRRLIAMMGDNIDPAMLDDEVLRAGALDNLINRKLLMQSAQAMDLAVSEREIGRVIGSMEQFQIDGEFSPQLYTSVLSSAGYTPGYFKQTLRDDIAMNQLSGGLAGSEFATPLERSLNARLGAEQRDFRYLTIPLDKFVSDQVATEEEIEAYYKANQNDFLTAESVVLEYIELSAENFRAPVDETAVQEAYRLEVDNAQYKTENRVSHILFEAGADESAEEVQARIDAARARLAEGVDFAEVAREFSDDVGSSTMGGDLGYSSGDAFPPEMEDAIAGLELNTVSDPVKTDAGIHLIKVTERREGSPPTLEELRPQLEDQLQLAAARVELLRTVEQLRDLVFNAESLDGPAAELDLEVQRSEPVTRTQSEGLFAHPALAAAAFSDEVLDEGHNSDVIELSGDRFVVLREHNHSLPEVMPLAEVRDDIAAIITENKARAMVAAEAGQAVRQLRNGADPEQVATSTGYEWQTELAASRRSTTVPTDVLSHAFSMPRPGSGETVVDYIMGPGGDARIIALERVTEGRYDDLEQSQQALLEQQISGEYAKLLNSEFVSGLRAGADISVM
jgi:peptidyl-prolyl cis-trans isomerase D